MGIALFSNRRILILKAGQAGTLESLVASMLTCQQTTGHFILICGLCFIHKLQYILIAACSLLVDTAGNAKIYPHWILLLE